MVSEKRELVDCCRGKSRGKRFIMKNETLVSDLVENLKAADPYKIVLFG